MSYKNRPYPLRIPDEMRDYLQSEADKNNRSLHAEIMVRLQSSIPDSVVIPKESFSRPSGSRKFVHQQKLQITDRRISSDPSDGQLKGLLAGMMGMPTPVGLIMYGLASLFDDDDDRSGEASFRLGLTEVFGADVGELIAKGPVDAVTGLNISGRTGLSDLWWRSPKEGVEGDDLTFHYVQQIAGPVLGIGVSAVRGMREFANGDVQRGVEAMAPKAVKDLAKAYRQASEGEQTRNGDSVINDVDAWHVASQAMGFSSADMAKIYSAREYIKGKEKIIEERRANLLADYFAALQSRDSGEMQDVMDNIREFNASHNKAEAITGKTLKQSIKSRERSGERTQAGTYLSSKREYLRSEGAFLSSLD